MNLSHDVDKLVDNLVQILLAQNRQQEQKRWLGPERVHYDG